jgi:hypothetical protein
MQLIGKLLLCIFLLQGTSWAATFRPFLTQDGRVAVAMEGDIIDSDGDVLRRQLVAAEQSGQRISALTLNSLGGSVYGGYYLSAVVRGARLDTSVPDGAVCLSACFLPYASGINRFAAASAQVGVHSVSYNDEENLATKSITVNMSRYLRGLGVPLQIIGKIVATEPNKVEDLTQEELIEMGVRVYAPSSEDISYVTHVAQTITTPKYSEVTPTSKDRKLARNLNKEATELLSKDKVSEAILKLNMAMIKYPFDAEILGNLGYAQYINKNYDQSRDYLTLSIKLKYDRAVTWWNLAACLAELNDHDQSVKSFLNYYKYSKDSSKFKQNKIIKLANSISSSDNIKVAAKVAIKQIRSM